MQKISIHTIVMYPRPHPDNIVAKFLLQEFGEEQFPGINQAKLEFWNMVPLEKTSDEWEKEGYLLIDMGGGKFDHHHDEHTNDKTTCASTLVARYLGIDSLPELKKLLEYVRRDDLEGRGIVSKDIIDRAFGLSAIVMNLNRDYPDHPEYVVETTQRIVLAHYHEEYRRKVLMPQEWENLQKNNLAEQFIVQTAHYPVKVVMVETDSKSIIGYLRAIGAVKADVVVQRQSSGHTNIVTRQVEPRLNLVPAISAIRQIEGQRKGLSFTEAESEQLIKPGRMAGVEEWYFDTAANTLQNGGANSVNIQPTHLSLEEIKQILIKTLPLGIVRTEPNRQRLANKYNRYQRRG
ncbi:MAG: hypothetical protein PHH01_00945 [Patescibacteria group bacterium]|nr:hypothetical protein [Patescibacteria group bacterium]